MSDNSDALTIRLQRSTNTYRVQTGGRGPAGPRGPVGPAGNASYEAGGGITISTITDGVTVLGDMISIDPSVVATHEYVTDVLAAIEGASYSAGTGIAITSNVISVDATIAAKAYVDLGLSVKADSSALAAYALSSDLASGLATKADTSTLSSYATTSALTSALASKADTSALSSYALTTALTTGLAGKADTSALSSYAPFASPTLTGTPTAPTASGGTNTTQIATTAFVTSAISAKANLASPTFTGTPAAPTATAGTNTTQLATTAFVTAGLSSKADTFSLSSYALTSSLASYAPLASPTLTGTPTAPTATAGTNTTQIATTAFVAAGLGLKADSTALSSYALTSSLALYAALASPIFTGTPAGPTASGGTSTTQLATTAFVAAEISSKSPKGLMTYVQGVPGASEVSGGAIAPYAMTLNATNSTAIATIAATSSTVFTIKLNGSSIGTVTFSASATAGVVAFTSTAVTKGQLLNIVAPGTADATLANITFLLVE